jgi:hypothetical protein
MEKLTTVEQVAVTLFDLCSDKSLSVTDITTRLVAAIDGAGLEATLEAVKQYRNTGVGLEDAARNILNPVKAEVGTNSGVNTYEQGRLNDIRTLLITDFGFSAEGLTDDKIALRDTDHGDHGLWVKESGKLYSVESVEYIRTQAVTTLTDYVNTYPEEVAKHGFTGVDDKSCEELLELADYSLDVVTLEGGSGDYYLLSEEYEEEEE